MPTNYILCVLLLCYIFRSVSPECEIAQTCITDFSVSECWGTQVIVPNSRVYNCCPSCGNAEPVEEDEDESEVAGVCRPPFNCLPDGRFAAVQCKGNLFTGRCFCTDGNGNRIFGQMWRDEASEMTCGCSRRRAELEAEGRVVTLHCTPSGDYEQLQCDDGMCWCAQPKTGQPIVSPIPEEDMKRLPCYSATVIGEQYLRKCESIVTSTALIAKEQSEHGTNFLGNPVTYCDYDGSYGPFQLRNGIAYCTDRNGEILGAWQATTEDMRGMNCHCARDTMMYFPDRGMTVTEICQGNGNYRPNQNVGDVYYCVDPDGYPGELLNKWPEDNCLSFGL